MRDGHVGLLDDIESSDQRIGHPDRYREVPVFEDNSVDRRRSPTKPDRFEGPSDERMKAIVNRDRWVTGTVRQACREVISHYPAELRVSGMASIKDPAPLFWLSLVAGALALVCAPTILLAEERDWSEAPIHVTQMVATVVCFVSSVVFLRSKEKGKDDWQRNIAGLACLLSGLWLALICIAVVLVGVELSQWD
jgi:hypothetical protein